ncbi:para-nitrobenzyl esterase [Paenibacillus sp. JCM 10914]|uniref:carboxylesterase/lipase family protein n=1 Tax=Paenibacillus sp. JCM 10914 TaxID=1236974 RepID=UPI0003CC6BEC|nr:carboxylesterase/lipase family protein [Paenibacillus sp. JCM 10914]GAE07733.1 NAD(P)H dehydrogenase [Paenibacillus sp. JCM 10914]
MTDLIIQTHHGKIQGIVEDGVRVWKGIPYAQPPSGELRFKAPVPPHAWEDIKVTDRYSPMCIQPMESTSSMLGGGVRKTVSEDCLYLNVWAPRKTPIEPLPVMVWIHGGAFVSGSSSLPTYNGASFVSRGDVLIVTINYRLGPLGFLHLAPFGTDYDSNAGLLDQIAALRWVQDNISSFGGDPGNVTLFGESAGSMSIAALLAMPSAKGLFHKAIMESGASQIMPPEQAMKITGGVLQELGLSPETLDQLRNLPAESIFEAGERLKKRVGAGANMLFQPVIDPDTMPQEPLQAVHNGSAQGIPLLIGTNQDEGSLFFRPEMPLIKEQDLVRAVEMMTGIEDAAPITREYPHTIDGHAQIMTDLYFWRSAIRFADVHSEHAPVWMYRFDWKLPGHPVLGKAMHALEIPFVFNTIHIFENIGYHADTAAQRLAAQMQDAWVAFAHHGSPSTQALPWPEYAEPGRMTMIFDTDSSVIQDPDPDKRQLLGL